MELLIVILIIGILSGIILASLSSARDKSKTAAIKANVDTIRKQANIWFDSKGTYFGVPYFGNNATGACFGTYNDNNTFWGDPVVKNALTAIDSLNGSVAIDCMLRETTSGSSSFSFHTVMPDGKRICLDHNNNIKSSVAIDDFVITNSTYCQ